MGVKNTEIRSHLLDIVLETMVVWKTLGRERKRKRKRVQNRILRLPTFKRQARDSE